MQTRNWNRRSTDGGGGCNRVRKRLGLIQHRWEEANAPPGHDEANASPGDPAHMNESLQSNQVGTRGDELGGQAKDLGDSYNKRASASSVDHETSTRLSAWARLIVCPLIFLRATIISLKNIALTAVISPAARRSR